MQVTAEQRQGGPSVSVGRGVAASRAGTRVELVRGYVIGRWTERIDRGGAIQEPILGQNTPVASVRQTGHKRDTEQQDHQQDDGTDEAMVLGRGQTNGLLRRHYFAGKRLLFHFLARFKHLNHLAHLFRNLGAALFFAGSYSAFVMARGRRDVEHLVVTIALNGGAVRVDAGHNGAVHISFLAAERRL